MFHRNDKQSGKGFFSEYQALERITAQFAVGGWCVGALAGLARGLYATDEMGPFVWSLAGMLLVATSGMLGCFAGFGLRMLLRMRRANKEDAEDQDTELVHSLALGTGVGSFLASIAAIVLGAWLATPFFAAAGACVCSAMFTLSGDVVRVLMRMIALDSRSARKHGSLANKAKENSGRIPLQQTSPPSHKPKEDWTKNRKKNSSADR